MTARCAKYVLNIDNPAGQGQTATSHCLASESFCSPPTQSSVDNSLVRQVPVFPRCTSPIRYAGVPYHFAAPLPGGKNGLSHACAFRPENQRPFQDSSRREPT
jgi:hypothetical protein